MPNSVHNEIFVDREREYPKRSRIISSLQPIFNYAKDLLQENNIDSASIPCLPLVPQIPPWEHKQAKFDTDYTDIKKDEDQNLLTAEVRCHLASQYSNHLKVFTDGSVLETGKCGAAFVIPDLKIQKSFHLGKGFSIFTCELMAILMALNYLVTVSFDIYNIVFYVDSKSVLLALKHWNCKVRKDIIFEIKFLIHCFALKGIGVNFCWIPSHCGLFWNELADFSAKQGASERPSDTFNFSLSLSSHEIITILTNWVRSNFFTAHPEKFFCPRQIELVIIYKLRLNA